MTSFTPIASLLGGALIGTSATAMLMLDGKVAGISGILGGLVRPKGGDVAWRALFAVGLLMGGFAMAELRPSSFDVASHSLFVVAVAGLLVGVGTALSNGCTSGHGVCGISRFSRRSIAATATFMATGAATVFVVRHLLGGAS
jgi:uncharacterized membrane protein YedE/YeeE